MVDDSRRIPKQIREDCPCNGCNERFTACSDRCPKDARGEFGHKAWKTEIDKIKKARRNYLEFATNKGYKFHWDDYGK